MTLETAGALRDRRAATRWRPRARRLLDAKGGTAGALDALRGRCARSTRSWLAARDRRSTSSSRSRRHHAGHDRSRTPAPRRLPDQRRRRRSAAARYRVDRLRRPRLRRRPRPGPPAAPSRDSGGLGGASLEVVAILLACLIARVRVRAHGLALAAGRRSSACSTAAQRARRAATSRIEVPTEGNDEFAALGTEFNSMARAARDAARGAAARARAPAARRSAASASRSPRASIATRVLEIVVQTAVDGVGAAVGRAAMRDGRRAAARRSRAQRRRRALPRALHAAEAAALDAEEVAETQIGGAFALARPLRAPRAATASSASSPSPATTDGFSAAERELFTYLTNQAAVSIENVDLHETVQRQAVTDELTGLFNHRRFQEVIVRRGRARPPLRRTTMGLIMLDIDNFKRVNDTYGHMQGDLVLREVARVLRESSREIDEPARYGGEEMAVALPQTDLDGAYQFAERVRQRDRGARAAAARRRRDAAGDRLVRRRRRWPAPTDADKDDLVAAADAALYRAKRSGQEPHGQGGVGCRQRRDGTARRRHPRAPRAQAPHGADPEEVARQEQEALGAPRRAEFAEPERPTRRGRTRRAPAEDAAAPTPSPRPPRAAGRRAGCRGRAASPSAELAARAEADPARRAPTWLDDEPDEARRARRSTRAASPQPSRRRGRARGDARLPPGDAGARPAVVRAEAAARLRPRPIAAHPYTLLDVFTGPAAGRQRARGRPRRRRALRRDHARVRARDAAVGDLVRPDGAEGGADYRHRIFMMSGEIPFAGHPSLGTAVAVARARGESRVDLRAADPARASRRSTSSSTALRASRLDAAGAAGVRRPSSIPTTCSALVGLDGEDGGPRAAVPGRLHRRRRRSSPACATPRALRRVLPDYDRIGAAAGRARRDRALPGRRRPRGAARRAPARSCARAEMGEDPATGSAVGPLAAHVAARTGVERLEIVQGVEMGRPSRLVASAGRRPRARRRRRR